MEQFTLEEEEIVGIDERGPEFIDSEILAAICEYADHRTTNLIAHASKIMLDFCFRKF